MYLESLVQPIILSELVRNVRSKLYIEKNALELYRYLLCDKYLSYITYDIY